MLDVKFQSGVDIRIKQSFAPSFQSADTKQFEGMTTAAEVFLYVSDHKIAVCKSCCYAVWPDRVRAHLRDIHKGLTANGRARIVQEVHGWPGLVRFGGRIELPQVLNEPIAGLSIFTDGKRCQLDPGDCMFICRNIKVMKKHWRDVHTWSVAGGRGGSRAPGVVEAMSQRQADAGTPVRCQRFFASGQHAGYFEVRPARIRQSSEARFKASGPDALVTAVLQDLAILERVQRERVEVVSDDPSLKEVSPWLQLTRWPSYLQGYKLKDVAVLLDQPNEQLEPVLVALGDSLERLVDDAYNSVCSDSINAFDQIHINSFLHRPRATDRPLFVKLQKSTWRQYIKIWKALLYFAYRTTRQNQRILLRHQLNVRQSACLEDTIESGEQVVRLSTGRAGTDGQIATSLSCARNDLDHACLALCISLLDHDVTGDLFESTIIAFFAVLAIDAGKGILKEAYHFTPNLSGFIKIAQMLVIQKAVIGARSDGGARPADTHRVSSSESKTAGTTISAGHKIAEDGSLERSLRLSATSSVATNGL